MTCVEFIRSLLDDLYAYLVVYKKYPENVANAVVGNVLFDLNLKLATGLHVNIIYMNHDNEWNFVSGGIDGYEQYYTIVTEDNRIPEIEYTEIGLPHLYESLEDAQQALGMYYEYFNHVHMEITTYKV